MEIINKIREFSKEKERYSYTILIHSYVNEDLIDSTKKKLENINKKIKDAHKKKFINDRIYSFISYLESAFSMKEKINCIFFINSKIKSIQLSKSEYSFCLKWNIMKYYMDYDDKFDVEYLTNLFSTDQLKIAFRFDKSNYQVVELDSVKFRVAENHTNMEEDSINFHITKLKPMVLYGTNQTLKKLQHLESNGITISLKNLSNEELLEIINKKTVTNNQELFRKEFLDNINNPSVMDKLLFGRNEVASAINNFMVKKLFVNPKIYSTLKENVDSSTLNFEVVIVQPLEPGDYGQVLNKDYGGIVALKYY